MATDNSLPEWHVDPAFAPAIEEVLPDLASEILTTIAREVPEYARPLEGSFGRGIRVGVDEALRQFVALVRDPAADRTAGRDVYFGLGHGELRQGRSLDSLQAAYRVGARVAWRRTSEAAARAGHPPERIYDLADAIFAYIDELSAESVEGYASAQREREGERELRRSRLLAAIVSGRGRDEIDRLAAEAGWQTPGTLAAAACDPETLGVAARRLGPETLSATVGELGCLLIADPEGPGREEELRRAAAAGPLTVGPAAPLERVAVSWAEAFDAHGARGRGGLPTTGLLRTDEHLAELVINASPERLERLTERALAPLAGETEASRRRLTTTLDVWLGQMGAVSPTAAAIGVHPQTVRYRVARLRELFGPALDDPAARFEVQLALRGARAGETNG